MSSEAQTPAEDQPQPSGKDQASSGKLGRKICCRTTIVGSCVTFLAGTIVYVMAHAGNIPQAFSPTGIAAMVVGGGIFFTSYIYTMLYVDYDAYESLGNEENPLLNGSKVEEQETNLDQAIATTIENHPANLGQDNAAADIPLDDQPGMSEEKVLAIIDDGIKSTSNLMSQVAQSIAETAGKELQAGSEKSETSNSESGKAEDGSGQGFSVESESLPLIESTEEKK